MTNWSSKLRGWRRRVRIVAGCNCYTCAPSGFPKHRL